MAVSYASSKFSYVSLLCLMPALSYDASSGQRIYIGGQIYEVPSWRIASGCDAHPR